MLALEHQVALLAARLRVEGSTSSFVFWDEGVSCLPLSGFGGAKSGSVTRPFFCSGESVLSCPELDHADVNKARPFSA